MPKSADFAVDMVNQVVEGFSDLKLAVHLCRRAGARVRGEARHAGGYDPILNNSTALKVNHLTMEFTAPKAAISRAEKTSRGFRSRLGCVSCQPGQIDSADAIFSRVKKRSTISRPSASR
jgi:hypothetical protein